MKNEYAQAFLEILKDGTSVDTALTGLRRVLDSKHHGKLLAPVLFEVLRTLESGKGAKEAVVTVAAKADTTTYKTKIEAVLLELGVSKDTPIKEVVDETLVGGFTVTFDYKEHDQSYKNALKSLYESITK